MQNNDSSDSPVTPQSFYQPLSHDVSGLNSFASPSARTGSLSHVLNTTDYDDQSQFARNYGPIQLQQEDLSLPESAENGGDTASKGRKRPRTETSRVTMSYPRKRAVTACQLCRARKTKCNNGRPKCKFCLDAGVECVYEDRSDHSSFDPASLMMLERLNQIIDRLDTFTPGTVQQNPSPLSNGQEPFTAGNLSAPSSHQQAEYPEEAYLKIPSGRTTADRILEWAIFKGKYSVDCLVETVFEADGEDEPGDTLLDPLLGPRKQRPVRVINHSINGGIKEEDIMDLLDSFLVFVHIKNPILDVDTVKQHAKKIIEDGLTWDGPSCLVLLCCALGSLARPFESVAHLSPPADGTEPDSLVDFGAELHTAASYYAMARKRIGLLDGNILRAQCYFLSAVYLMYTLRPLEAWQNFMQASTTYHVYLKGRTRLNDSQGMVETRTRRLEQRLYWSCFKSECEIRVELSLPESSIASIHYPDLFPSPPNAVSVTDTDEAVVDSPSVDPSTTSPTEKRNRTHSFRDSQQQSWYYYLSEIALRRIGNRILNAFYSTDHHPGYNMTVPQMIEVATNFETQLAQWYNGLPPSIAFSHSRTILPTTELPYMTRGRYHDSRAIIYQPFIYYAIHHEISDPYRYLVQPFVDKAFDVYFKIIESASTHHRHHGTWYSARSGTTSALLIIAAVKSRRVEPPGDWRDVVRCQIATLKYWEKETPDLRKGKIILEGLLKEVENLGSV